MCNVWSKEDPEEPQERVFLVGHRGPEHNIVCYVCGDRETAENKWHDVRRRLLDDAYRQQGWNVAEYGEPSEMYSRIIENLRCEDPEEIDCYPHSTPYIEERGVYGGVPKKVLEMKGMGDE